MTVTRRTITVETWQRTVIRQTSRQPPKIWCEFCADNVEIITSEQAAVIFDISLQEIYQDIENGRLHFAESRNQLPDICINSLKVNK